MDKLEDITTEVAPSTIGITKQDTVNIDDIITKIISTLYSEEVEMFKLGQVKRGNRQLNNLDILKEGLYREIETLNLTKTINDDKIERIINSKTKKVLQQQVDGIISILQMSTDTADNRHFLLGLILRLLIEK
jgi:hypothetical protein